MKISIITATRNSAHTLVDCLQSVSAQSWPIREHWVIDGASSDGTRDLLAGEPELSCRWISEPDHGIYHALNKGIARATGDVIGFLHADDLFSAPDVLELVATAFEDDRVDAVYGDLHYVAKQDTQRVIRRWRSSPVSARALNWGWMAPHPALYVRRGWYERIGGFDTSYSIAADYHSMLRLFGNPNFRAVHIPQVLVKMRVGGASNRSVANIIRKSREDLRALQENGVGALGGYGALAWKNLSKLGQFWNKG